MAGLQGRVVGGYQLGDQLSSGGVAEVYRARPPQSGGREAVVKVIYPEFARQAGFRDRFDRVVQMAKRLDHPHILPLLGSGEQQGYLYLITPYVAAGTLRDWMKAGRRLGTHDVGPFFRQVCEATTYAHSQSVVHGNIKPSNIFLFEGRHVLLGDFGRLWEVGQMDMTHAGTGLEAVEFLAPEAVDGRADQQGDIYSLGAVLFASLTGAPPFRGATPFEVLGQHARQAPPHLTAVAPPVPAGVIPLDAVVQRALAKAPEGRYASALALAQAIETTLRGGVPQSSAGSGRAASPFAAPSRVDAGLGRASFPPLPASAMVEPSMEEGRFALSPPLPGQSSYATAVEKLPTTALPSQPGIPEFPSSSMSRATQSSGVEAQPTQRVPASTGLGASSSAGFGQAPSAPFAGGGPAAADAGLAPPQHQGFLVAGGASQWPPPMPSGGTPPSHLSADPGVGAADYSIYRPASPDGGPDGLTGGEHPFSATKLGLPRLTTPELHGLPASWRELASGPVNEAQRESTVDQAPAWGDRAARADDGGQWGASSADWEASSYGESVYGGAVPRRGDDSDRWGESVADSRAYSAARDPWAMSSADAGAVPDIYTSSSIAAVQGGRDANRVGWRSGSGGGWGRSGLRDADHRDDGPAPDEDTPEDPFAWARPKEKRRKWKVNGRLPRGREPRVGGSRHVGRLLLFVALLVVVDGALVAAVRPDLCPQNACASAHAKLSHYLPMLTALGSAAPLTVSPTHVTLSVVAGSTSAAEVTLTNLSHQSVSWSAKSGLNWLVADPTTASLSAGSTGRVIFSAHPAKTLPARTYTTTVVFTIGSTTLSVPVAITVSAWHG